MASPPLRPANPLPTANVIVNKRSTSMPTDCAMRRLSTAANLGADVSALEAIPKRKNQSRADSDEKDPIGRKRAGAQVKPPGQVIRYADRLRQRPIEIRVGRDRHESQPDGQQNLVEFARVVELRIQCSLKQDADDADDNEGNDEGSENGIPQPAVAVITR